MFHDTSAFTILRRTPGDNRVLNGNISKTTRYNCFISYTYIIPGPDVGRSDMYSIAVVIRFTKYHEINMEIWKINANHMSQQPRPLSDCGYSSWRHLMDTYLNVNLNVVLVDRWGVAVQNVERSRTSKVSGSQRRLARRYGPRLASLECISGPGCRSTKFWVLFMDLILTCVTKVNVYCDQRKRRDCRINIWVNHAYYSLC